MEETRTELVAAPRKVYLNIAIDPDLRNGMRVAAILEGVDMIEWLHVLLCEKLDRLDLIHRVPASR